MKEVTPSPGRKMIKRLTFDNLFPHYNILAKTRSRVKTATTFSRQNDAGSRVNNTQYWENLVLVVVLVLESKALYYLKTKTTTSMGNRKTTSTRFFQY